MVKELRKRPVKSPHLFPSYPFNTAITLASMVARDGGGSLSEATLAMILGISAKSSGFRLKVLSARQFGLVAKNGEILSATPLAKAIIQPASQAEERQAKIASFLEVPLFKAIATRFKGQPLPPDRMLRHILEQEFCLESNRVGEAERIFQDSAREAGLLRASGEKMYLDTETALGQPSDFMTKLEPAGQLKLALQRDPSILSGNLMTISEEDLAGLNDAEYAEIWQALGKLIRARSRRLQKPDSTCDTGL
jgi:hypothetical protein